MVGKNPFADWQQAKQERREALVREFLAYMKKKRLKCEYITDLADMLAKHISEQEGASCNRATLLRNKRYKVLLLSYMAHSCAEGTDAIDRRSLDDPKAGALVIAAEVGAESLRREINRLKAYIAELEATKSQLGPLKVSPPVTQNSVDDLTRKHVLTCQALLAILKHFDGLLLVDTDGQRVMDASTRPQKVVVDKKFSAPFFEWMNLNRDVGGSL
ncbi:hypothetical protein [Delftia sp. ZNC0008]|uniref:hypothetical protein n=1 Tax=Delftia sp. ZNC0008 TaxID=1339242 RepID=UPI0012DFF388|nr:hypothetical protein [Delftia sp. ZNC0008]